jgi:hypothetical protein
VVPELYGFSNVDVPCAPLVACANACCSISVSNAFDSATPRFGWVIDRPTQEATFSQNDFGYNCADGSMLMMPNCPAM